MTREGSAVARPAMGKAATLQLTALALVTYEFLFQLTKPSPLSTASMGQLLTVAAYAFLLATLVATVCLPLALVVDWSWSRLRPDSSIPLGTVAISGLLLALGLLVFTENLLYSVKSVGLKTDDGLLLKLAFGILALSVGMFVGRRMSRLSPRTTKVVVLGTAVLLPVSLLSATLYLADHPDPEPLRADDAPNLVNVVILSSDAINASRMAVYGYRRNTTPFLRERVSEFQVYENAFTNTGNTTGSMVTLLTGSSPDATGVLYPPDTLQADDALHTLPYLLGELGYYRSNWAVPHYSDGREQNLVHAFDTDNGHQEAGSPLRWLPLGTGTARWFVHEALESPAGLAADVVGVRELTNPYSQVSPLVGDTLSDTDRLDAVLGELETHSRFFVNTHFMVTHGPAFLIDEPHFSEGDEQTEWWQRDFYDDAVRQFDSYVEAVYDKLVETSELDNTLLIVTSDHGIEHDPTTRIPLMIRFPDGTPAGRANANVQRLDVAPTVLDVLGFAPPSWMTGMSLTDPSVIPPDREIDSETITARVAPNNLGFRAADGELLLTTVKCRSFLTREPSGSVVEGEVAGSTASCPATP